MRKTVVASLSVVSFLGAGPILAQVRSQNPARAQAQSTAVNPEVIGLQMSADLVARDLNFSALGAIMFRLVNRGAIAVNPATEKGGSSNTPIKIDLYLNSTLVQSVYQPSLGGNASRAFTVVPSNVPRCNESRDLRVVIDAQNAIPEWSNDNNVTAAAVARPCPDLAIKSIERDYTGLLKETYSPKVVVINQGNAPSPSTQVWGTSLPGGVWPVTGWPELVPTHTIPALAPGDTTSFHTGGSVLSVNRTAIRVMLDRHFEVDELDEGNNSKDERL